MVVLLSLLIVVLSLVSILVLLRLYCRLTMGRCNSDQDMTGRTVLITGTSAGIGKATALLLARRNARVIMACRNLVKAKKVKTEIITATGNTNIEIKLLDLESLDSVRKCAEDVIKTENRLDVLINNAGIARVFKGRTKDGWERNMQINHLGHFLLTLLLLDLLKKSKPSRVINVSSITYQAAILDVEDMDGSKHSSILAYLGNLYYSSKLANILFTTELARRLDGTGITVNALHPGLIHHTDFWYRINHPVVFIFQFIVHLFGKSPKEGAQTTLYLAVHPDLETATGKYFTDCHETKLIGKAKDIVLARKLFEISERTVGESYKD